MPVWEKTERADGTFSVTDFHWDEQANEYRCPRGDPLRSEWRAFKTPRAHITLADTVIYRSSQRACADCPLKPRCCPNTPMRKISHSLYEKSRAVARKVADTDTDTDAYRQMRPPNWDAPLYAVVIHSTAATLARRVDVRLQ